MHTPPLPSSDASDPRPPSSEPPAPRGEGTFGVVTCEWHASTARFAAVKTLKSDAGTHDVVQGLELEAVRELLALRAASHAHVIGLLEARAAADRPVAFVLCDGGESLGAALGEKRALSARHVMRGVAAGVAHLHAHRIMHRDIKPANVLVDAKGRVRVCDLGSARAFRLRTGAAAARTYTANPTTLWYAAPEVLVGGGRYDEKLDCWSMGCMFAELCVGVAPFAANSAGEVLHRICAALAPCEAAHVRALAPDGQVPPASAQARGARLVDEPALRADASLVGALLRAEPRVRWSARALADALDTPDDAAALARAAKRRAIGTRPRALVPQARALRVWSALPVATHASVNAEMRRILVEWLGEVSLLSYRQEEDVFVAAVRVVDLALVVRCVPRAQLQLLGCGALLLAARALSTLDVCVHSLAALTAGACTAEQIGDMQRALALDARVSCAVYGLPNPHADGATEPPRACEWARVVLCALAIACDLSQPLDAWDWLRLGAVAASAAASATHASLLHWDGDNRATGDEEGLWRASAADECALRDARSAIDYGLRWLLARRSRLVVDAAGDVHASYFAWIAFCHTKLPPRARDDTGTHDAQVD